jgi:heme-degrading monooxygenase HmoA
VFFQMEVLGMIMRVWHGWTRPENASAYEALLRTDILPGIHRISGYRGAYLLRRDDANETEFITITTWDSWDAVREFSGDHKTAVVPPQARQLLSRFDETSAHYEANWIP